MFDDFIAEAYPGQVNNDSRPNHVVQTQFSSNPTTTNPIKREYHGPGAEMAQTNSEDEDDSIWILDSDDEMQTVCDNQQGDEKPSTSKNLRSSAGSGINDMISAKIRNQSNTKSAVNVISRSRGTKKSEKYPKRRPRNVGSLKCEICREPFRVNKDLIFHRRLHLASSSIHCRVCLRRFSKMDDMKDHENCCNLLRYECYLCRCSKNGKLLLERHMLTHSNKKAFNCNRCGKHLKRKESLIYHGKFACRVKKGKSFVQKN